MLDKRRKLEIWKGITRHVLGIIHLLAELYLGYKPQDLTDWQK